MVQTWHCLTDLAITYFLMYLQLVPAQKVKEGFTNLLIKKLPFAICNSNNKTFKKTDSIMSTYRHSGIDFKIPFLLLLFFFYITKQENIKEEFCKGARPLDAVCLYASVCVRIVRAVCVCNFETIDGVEWNKGSDLFCECTVLIVLVTTTSSF